MDNKQIIIYGAGKRGVACYEFIKARGKENIVYAFCDRNYNEISQIDGKRVISFEEARDCKMPFLISVVEAAEEIKSMITKVGCDWINLEELSLILGENRVKSNHDFCSFFHIEGMDDYFESAENESSINVFWQKDTPFYQEFVKLDLENVIELACGRGRHVPHYIKNAGHITLVDILQKNIDMCKDRFKDEDKISYYCNNGFNLEELPSDTYSALFCYDAMVHFEMMDIYEYLKDIFRVLKSGGLALIHHSNNSNDYKASFTNSNYGRSFMSETLFAYLAYRCGFTICSQKTIDWGVKDLDCISLIMKPYNM